MGKEELLLLQCTNPPLPLKHTELNSPSLLLGFSLPLRGNWNVRHNNYVTKPLPDTFSQSSFAAGSQPLPSTLCAALCWLRLCNPVAWILQKYDSFSEAFGTIVSLIAPPGCLVIQMSLRPLGDLAALLEKGSATSRVHTLQTKALQDRRATNRSWQRHGGMTGHQKPLAWTPRG